MTGRTILFLSALVVTVGGGAVHPFGPVKQENTLAFMFETRFPQQLTRYAAELPTLQDDYPACWSGLEKTIR